MDRVWFTPEQIIGKLREAAVLLGQGTNIGEAIRKLGVSEQTYYRWRKEYVGMRVDQARRLKKLETENGRLKKLAADLCQQASNINPLRASINDPPSHGFSSTSGSSGSPRSKSHKMDRGVIFRCPQGVNFARPLTT